MGAQIYILDHATTPGVPKDGGNPDYIMVSPDIVEHPFGRDLTTPVAYLASIPFDAFNTQMARGTGDGGGWWKILWGKGKQAALLANAWGPNCDVGPGGIPVLEFWHRFWDLMISPLIASLTRARVRVFCGGASRPVKSFTTHQRHHQSRRHLGLWQREDLSR